MKHDQVNDEVHAFEEAVEAAKGKKYLLKLYVAGATPKSSKAIMRIKEICEQHLKGRYELEVIDIYQQPALARRDQIVAAPTLIKQLPLPLRKFIGNIEESHHILVGLDVVPEAGDVTEDTAGRFRQRKVR